MLWKMNGIVLFNLYLCQIFQFKYQVNQIQYSKVK